MRARSGRSSLTVAVAVFLLMAAFPVQSEDVEARPGDTVEWYVVQPGDTLERLTQKYLGNPRLWRENWRLNPELENPHLLQPGERLRIIVDRQLPDRSAEIQKIERRVEAKPHPEPWGPARVGAQLFEQDGVRTYRRSSAELAFDDGTSVVMTENSLLFVRAVGESVVHGRHESIEVVQGQADLEARAADAAKSSDIEVIIGEVRAQPAVNSAGVAKSRLRRPQTGGAEVMVFDGTTSVAAAGQEVEVPAGMGTSVPEGQAPLPPEKLLPAPVPVVPADGQRFAYCNPLFSWQTVAGATSYTVEVCADTHCAELVDRVEGFAATTWQPQGLATGELFWRVTARAASGLDGFPARARPLSIDSDQVDFMPPAVVIVADPPAVAVDGRRVVVPPASSLTIRAHDDASGVRELTAHWNENPWFPIGGGTLTAPAEPGTYTLSLRAIDNINLESAPTVVEVVVDGAVPKAPGLTAAPDDR